MIEKVLSPSLESKGIIRGSNPSGGFTTWDKLAVIDPMPRALERDPCLQGRMGVAKDSIGRAWPWRGNLTGPGAMLKIKKPALEIGYHGHHRIHQEQGLCIARVLHGLRDVHHRRRGGGKQPGPVSDAGIHPGPHPGWCPFLPQEREEESTGAIKPPIRVKSNVLIPW